MRISGGPKTKAELWLTIEIPYSRFYLLMSIDNDGDLPRDQHTMEHWRSQHWNTQNEVRLSWIMSEEKRSKAASEIE